MRVTLVHNPKSGKHQKTSKRELLDLLSAAGHETTYQSTKKHDWKQSLEEPGELVVIAGGDGTIARVLKLLAGRHIPVGVLPTGTSNNIASSLGLHGPPEELIRHWSTAKITPFDLGIVAASDDEHAFAEAFGLGMFGRFLRMSAKRARDGAGSAKRTTSGKPRFGIPLMLEALEKTRGHECALSIDGRDVSDEYVMIEVMNIRSIGGRLMFAPDADPGDGSFDVVAVRASERAELADFLHAHAAGKHLGNSLPCVRARSIELVCGGSELHLDDKRWPKGRRKQYRNPETGETSLTIRLQPGAAEVLL